MNPKASIINRKPPWGIAASVALAALLCSTATLRAQLIDRTKAPNRANEGVGKALGHQIGRGRGDANTLDSSAYIIARDPFRSIRRGRQLFQRKFSLDEGLGPRTGDGRGDVNTVLAIGAGLADSCAACHGRPRGSAGFGGDVATRPDSRDAPHLFGLGLKEMLADEITADLRALRTQAINSARENSQDSTRDGDRRDRRGDFGARRGDSGGSSYDKSVTVALVSKGINFGSLTAKPDGSVDTSKVRGVNPDLRVRPFFAHGGTISMREFIVGALNDEMGLQAVDPELATARAGGHFVTPSGMVLDGAQDQLNAPPTADPHADPDGDSVRNEIPTSLVDHFEFYLLNYFKAGTYETNRQTARGRAIFSQIGCARCHVPDLRIDSDRRVADVETVFDPAKDGFNGLFATATPLFDAVNDTPGLPSLKTPKGGSFLVKNIFTDFKRHDLGPNFHERNYDGTIQREFLTTPLWGVGSTAPYGHDGRSINLAEVIIRHGGEAQQEGSTFDHLDDNDRNAVLAFLNSLVIFPPDDTSSNLNPGNRNDPGFPQTGHGSIRLTGLFNDPNDPE